MDVVHSVQNCAKRGKDKYLQGSLTENREIIFHDDRSIQKGGIWKGEMDEGCSVC